MKSGKLKSKIKTYQIRKYRIACTGLVIYFEFKAKKNSQIQMKTLTQSRKKSSSSSNAILLLTQPAMNFIYASIWWMNNNDEHDI